MSSKAPDTECSLTDSFGQLCVDKIQHWLKQFSSRSSDKAICVNLNKPSLAGQLMKAPLIERDDCIQTIRSVFSERAEVYVSSWQSERENYRIPVLVGIPGIGKSRMLNEYKRFLPDDVGFVAACFVVYNNGHSITSADEQLNINQTFAARLLHWFFQEGLVGSDAMRFSTLMESLLSFPERFSSLTLILACQVIRAALEEAGMITSYDKLTLYIAIDEYQVIPDGSESKSRLHQLTDLLVDASIKLPASNIFLFPVFAGVEWGEITAFSSSNPLLVKVTPSLLSLPGSLKIASALFPKGFCSSEFLDCMTELGDHPRLAVRFATEAFKLGRKPANSFLELRTQTLTNHGIGSQKGLSTVDLMKLIAHAVVGSQVTPDASSGINDLSWEQLASRGLLQISSTQHVHVSFAFLYAFCIGMEQALRMISNYTAKLFGIALEYIVVKLPLIQLEPREKWEHFGPLARASEDILTIQATLFGGHILIGDQRNLDCKPLTTDLLEKLNIVAKAVCPPVENIKCMVSVMCSALANFGKQKVEIPSRRTNKTTNFSKLSEFVKVYCDITSNSTFPLPLRELLLLDDDMDEDDTEGEEGEEGEGVVGDKDED
eukprot:gene27558-33284_t